MRNPKAFNKRKYYLSLLHLQNSVLDCISDHDPLNMDLPHLANSMHAIKGLRFYRLRPSEIKGNDIIGTTEIQTYT